MKTLKTTLIILSSIFSVYLFAIPDDVTSIMAKRGYIPLKEYSINELDTEVTKFDVIKAAVRINKKIISKNYSCQGIIKSDSYRIGSISEECGIVEYAIEQGWVSKDVKDTDLQSKISYFEMLKIMILASKIPKAEFTHLTRYRFSEEDAKIFSVLWDYSLISSQNLGNIELHYILPQTGGGVNFSTFLWHVFIFDSGILMKSDDQYFDEDGKQKLKISFPDKSFKTVIVDKLGSPEMIGFSDEKIYYTFMVDNDTINGGDDHDSLLIVDTKMKTVKYLPIDYSEIIVTPSLTLFKIFGKIVMIEGKKITTFTLPKSIKNFPMRYITFSPDRKKFAYIAFGGFSKNDKIVVVNIEKKDVQVLKNEDIKHSACILGWKDNDIVKAKDDCIDY